MRFWIICFAVALLSGGCTRKASQKISNAVVVRVNDDILTAGEFSIQITKRLKNFDALAAKDPTNLKKAKEEAIKDFVVSCLLRQFAQKHGLSVSQSELEGEVDRVRKTYPDDLTFRAALTQDGQTTADWKKSIERSLLEKKAFSLIGASPQNQEALAKKYYDEHRPGFVRPEQAHIHQIVVAKQDEADRLHKSLKAGASFSEIAKKFSISPDASQGGDIGYVSKGSVPVFDIAFRMRVGQLSGVVKSKYGFHIIKVVDKRPASHLSFEQAKGKILKVLAAGQQQETFTRWLEDAIKAAKIERNDVVIEKIRAYTEGLQE